MRRFIKTSLSLLFVFGIGALHAQGATAPPNAPAPITIDGAPLANGWQLPETHFVSAKMPMTLVHPRSMPGTDETSPWARHKKAYPGIEYRIPISIQGGAYPFYYEIVSGPSWLSIGQQYGGDNYGVLFGTPPATPQPVETVVLRVTDQELTEIDIEFPLQVTDSTSDFIFVATDAAGGGTGAIDSPLQFGEVFPPSGGSYADRIVYLRGGVHSILPYPDPPYWQGGHRGVVDLSSGKPLVILGYPDESVELDCINGRFVGGGEDFFFGGIKLKNTPQYGMDGSKLLKGSFFEYPGNARITFFENEWRHLRFPWVNRHYNLVYVSPNSFKVLGYDATHADRYGANADLRFYDQVSDPVDVEANVYGVSKVLNSMFDGTDTLVVMNAPVVPENLVHVRQRYNRGNNGGAFFPGRPEGHRPYFTLWGNFFDDFTTRAFGPMYTMGPAVVENNFLGTTVPYVEDNTSPSSGIDFKASSTFISFRRNVSLVGKYWYGALQAEGFGTGLTVATGAHDQQVEFCYNLIRADPDNRILSAKRTANGGETHTASNTWVYRNTIIGQVHGNADYSNLFFEKNLYFTSRRPYPSGNVFVEDDIQESYANQAKYLDPDFRLKGAYRDSHLGTHGHEISR